MPALLRIGLTGGIGSGKSTVCKVFSEYNVPVIDADRISHDLLLPDRPGYTAVVKLFGDRIITETGEIDRPLLRKLVFSDDSSKKALEELLHPMVFDEIREKVLQLEAEYCVISIPLLVESGCRQLVDRVLVVEAPEETRLKRAADRDNTTPEQIRKIMRAQATPEQRKAVADDIIVNDGNIESLKQQVAGLHNLYKKMATELRYKPDPDC